MYRTTIEIYPQPPYDFGKMIRRLQGVGHEMFRVLGERLVRTIRFDDQIFVMEVQALGTIEEPKLQVHLYGEQRLPETRLGAIEEQIGLMLSTHVPVQSFYEQMKHDAIFNGIVERFMGLRLILEAGLFECMVKTIVGQQLNLAFAATLNRRLMALTTVPVQWEGMELPVFPSCEQVAKLEYSQLREQQYSQRKAEYVIDFARAVLNGTINLTDLFTKTNEEIIAELSKVRGIGRWTVECFLMFGMGRTDLLPAADIGLRNAVKKNYGLETQPSEAEVRQYGAGWSPWSSYATFYLWETMNDKS